MEGDAGALDCHPRHCWYSLPTQLRSIAALTARYGWLHALPGHGRPHSFSDVAARDAAVAALLREQGGG
jgi:hypothetical protein